MKIALLGAALAGKTVYFSALYYRFRNQVTFPNLSAISEQRMERGEMTRQLGFRLSVPNAALDGELSNRAEGFNEIPIRWPDFTSRLDKATLDVTFEFRHLPPKNNQSLNDAYIRTMEIYDPAGGAVAGTHVQSEEVRAELGRCDIAITFIAADTVGKHIPDYTSCASNSEEMQDVISRIKFELRWGAINGLLSDIGTGIGENDIFPVCMVISKCDLIATGDMNILLDIVVNKLLRPLSESHPKLLLCICPISVVDPESQKCKIRNVEWPFVFAAGGTIFRNSRELEQEADEKYEISRRALARANELRAIRQRSWWERFVRWIDDDFETVGQWERRAQSYTNAAGRKVQLARDDARLARDVWITLAEQQSLGVHIMMDGKDVDIRKELL